MKIEAEDARFKKDLWLKENKQKFKLRDRERENLHKIDLYNSPYLGKKPA